MPLCIVSVNYVLSNREVAELVLTEVQLNTKTNGSDPLTATTPNPTAIPSPQATLSPASYDSIVNYHASPETVPDVPQSIHQQQFQPIDSQTQPAIPDHMQNGPDFVQAAHLNKSIPIENQSIQPTYADNFHLLWEHFEQQQQQSYKNFGHSTDVIHHTSPDIQMHASYNDANQLSAVWDDYMNYEAPHHSYEMNYFEENDYSINFPSDFHSKCIKSYGIEENYNVLCNV